MKNVDLKKILGLLNTMLRCPICNYKYDINSMKVLENTHNELLGEASILVHSDCKKCHGSVMFSIGVYGPEVTSIASVTDLTLEDTKRFRAAPVLSANDVLAVHKEIKKFKGDFVKAFQTNS